MNTRTVKDKIKGLNNPQLGSFGEYLFSNYILNELHKRLVKVHRDGTDFIFDGNAIDVGARRNLNQKYSADIIRNKDAFVFFNKDCCVIKYPSKFEAKISWYHVSLLFVKWLINHSPIILPHPVPAAPEY